MPRAVRTSLWLLISSFVATPLLVYFDPRPGPPIPSGSEDFLVAMELVIFLPITILLAFIASRAFKGQNWARWVYAAMYAISMSVSAPLLFNDVAKDIASNPLYGLLGSVDLFAQLASVVLLFVHKSNEWYKTSGIKEDAT